MKNILTFAFVIIFVLAIMIFSIMASEEAYKQDDVYLLYSKSDFEIGDQEASDEFEHEENFIRIMPAEFSGELEIDITAEENNTWNIPYTPHPYLNPNAYLKTLFRPIPVFENRGDLRYVYILPPQTVEVLGKSDNWWYVSTSLGAKWVNINFAPPTYELDAFLSPFGQRISVYFKNLETGFEYSYNPDRVFFGASISKATQGLYAFIAAERGYIDMYAVHTYRASDFMGGTGIIRFMQVGTEFTTRELLHYSIVHSDNIAFRMLARYMARTGFSFRDFVMEIGASPRFILDRYMDNITASEAMLWLNAIHSYFESESRYGHYFQDDLLNVAMYSHPYFTRGNAFGGTNDIVVQFIHSDYPIAQKYGWGNNSFHVIGIVYAPSPYLLVIFSNMENGAHELYEEISWKLQAFNARYFAGQTY